MLGRLESPEITLVDVCQSAVHCCQQCLQVKGGYSGNLQQLPMSKRTTASAHTEYKPFLNCVMGIFVYECAYTFSTLCMCVILKAAI